MQVDARQIRITLEIQLRTNKRWIFAPTLPALVAGVVVAGQAFFALGKNIIVDEVVPPGIEVDGPEALAGMIKNIPVLS